MTVTKPEWKAVKRPIPNSAAMFYRIIENESDTVCKDIAVTQDRMNTVQDNYALIAAAPDMLEALAYICTEDNIDLLSPVAVDLIRNALTKILEPVELEE